MNDDLLTLEERLRGLRQSKVPLTGLRLRPYFLREVRNDVHTRRNWQQALEERRARHFAWGALALGLAGPLVAWLVVELLR